MGTWYKIAAKGASVATTLKNVVAVGDDDGASSGAATSSPDLLNSLVESLNLNGFTKSTLDHNRFTSIAVVLAVVLIGIVKIWQPTVEDPYNKGHYVTVAAIKTEHDQLVAQYQSNITQDQKDLTDMLTKVNAALQQLQAENQELGSVISAVATIAAPFAGPFAPVVLAAAGLVTAGLGFDTVRKTGQATQSSNIANSQTNASPNTAGNQGGVDAGVTQLTQALITALTKSKT